MSLEKITEILIIFLGELLSNIKDNYAAIDVGYFRDTSANFRSKGVAGIYVLRKMLYVASNLFFQIFSIQSNDHPRTFLIAAG